MIYQPYMKSMYKVGSETEYLCLHVDDIFVMWDNHGFINCECIY